MYMSKIRLDSQEFIFQVKFKPTIHLRKKTRRRKSWYELGESLQHWEKENLLGKLLQASLNSPIFWGEQTIATWLANLRDFH